MSITAALLICFAPVAYDGDTIRCGASKTTVRVFGIEAPEIGTSGSLDSRVNVQALSDGGVWCEPRGTNYSRIVAICYNSKGVDIGRAQLQGGFAKEWCAYSRNYYGTCVVARRRKR